MDQELERDLVRLTTGELGDERRARLERAIEADPALQRRREEYRELWRALELPAPRPADLLPALRRRIASEARQAGPVDLWRLASGWGRALAAASLAAGVALGVWLGQNAFVEEELAVLESYEPSLAESYWIGLEKGDERLTEGGER